MRVVHVATEVFPVAKVGGLGDVIYGLAKESSKLGAHVDIILPKYASIHLEMSCDQESILVIEDDAEYGNKVYKAKLENINLIFIEATDHPKGYFSRGSIYGEKDDIDRFLYFSFAAAQFILKKGNYDAVHVHDWATAIIPSLLPDINTVFTIHNLHHQGLCSPHNLNRLNYPHELSPLFDRREKGTLNLMQAGIRYANHITTVSPTYAEEITGEPLGCGLSWCIEEHAKNLQGILNGLDETYNPETDPNLDTNYTPKDALKAKKQNQEALFKELGLTQSEGPTICAISRLVDQKGPELIQYAIDYTIEHGGNFLLLGSSNDEAILETFKLLLEKHSETKRISFHFTFNETLARKIFASSDLLVMPSSFEPCGLTQLIGMRYGTVPIAFATGGLVDTVNEKNGFLFREYTAKSFHHALEKAFQADLTPMIEHGMEADFSWNRAAKQYLELYATSKLL